MALRDTRTWFVLAVLVTLSVLIYLLSPILTPFVFGMLLAYLGDPLVDRLERHRISRTLAVTLVFLGLFVLTALLILLIVPLLQTQLVGFFQDLPRYGEWLDKQISAIVAYFELGDGTTSAATFKDLAKEYLPQAGNATKNIFKAISQSGGALINGVLTFFLTPIVTFYFLRDWDTMVSRIQRLVPRSMSNTVNYLASESDSVLSAFLRGQFLVMIALGTIYAVGLSIIGLKFAVLVGFVAGLLSFIPYLGTLVGVVLASVLFLVQTQDWIALWQVGLVFLVGQSLEGYVLTPWLVGDRIGLHPVAVIFAVLAGGQLFGFVGVLLALPAAAVLAVLIRYGIERYKASELYNRPQQSASGQRGDKDGEV